MVTAVTSDATVKMEEPVSLRQEFVCVRLVSVVTSVKMAALLVTTKNIAMSRA